MKININNLDQFEDNKFERIKRKKPNWNNSPKKMDKKRKPNEDKSNENYT